MPPLPLADQVAAGAAQAARRIGQRVDVVLHPEGLGTVSLRVSVERAGLGIHIAVDNPTAREMLQASWPQLQQALDQRGLSVHSMFLDLAGGRSGGEAFQAFQQFGGQPFSDQQARGGSSATGRREAPIASALDDESRLHTGAGAASRVDYRI
jgi:flagellar hook-length control protein FliK